MIKKLALISLTAVWLFSGGCARQTPVAACLHRFPLRSDWPDTLHCFLDTSLAGNPVSDTLLRAALDSTQFESLHYQTGEARFKALGQFPFAKGLNAGLLQTEEFWFGKLTLLVFDPKQQKCISVVELSHFYGGDGGQTASESWLFRDGTAPKLYVKNAEHWLKPPENESDAPQEFLQEEGRLFQWEGKQFGPISHPDSALFLKRYVMHREW